MPTIWRLCSDPRPGTGLAELGDGEEEVLGADVVADRPCHR
jgi:hypothetical protein